MELIENTFSSFNGLRKREAEVFCSLPILVIVVTRNGAARRLLFNLNGAARTFQFEFNFDLIVERK